MHDFVAPPDSAKLTTAQSLLSVNYIIAIPLILLIHSSNYYILTN